LDELGKTEAELAKA